MAGLASATLYHIFSTSRKAILLDNMFMTKTILLVYGNKKYKKHHNKGLPLSHTLENSKVRMRGASGVLPPKSKPKSECLVVVLVVCLAP